MLAPFINLFIRLGISPAAAAGDEDCSRRHDNDKHGDRQRGAERDRRAADDPHNLVHRRTLHDSANEIKTRTWVARHNLLTYKLPI